MVKKKSNAGRKETITPEIANRLEEKFRIDATDEQACLHAGCSKSAYYRKLKADDRFRKRMHAAQHYLPMRAKQNVADRIEKGDAEYARWLLERREKDRYSTRIEQKHEGEVAVTYADLEGKKPKTVDEARDLAEQTEWDDEE